MDVVNPIGGVGAPAPDNILLPPTPGDWLRCSYPIKYYASEDTIIYTESNIMRAIDRATGQVTTSFSTTGWVEEGIVSIRGSSVFISPQNDFPNRRIYRYF